MGEVWNKFYRITLLWLVALVLSLGFVSRLSAEVYYNILAVNGTDLKRVRDIRQPLPPELAAEDIIDTAGLELEYDVTQGHYVVIGKVELDPKETRTYKIRVRDVWTIDKENIGDIKREIDASLKRVENTKYYEVGEIRRESLLNRLDFVIGEQERFADDINKRIDRYRVYSDEIKEIRGNSLSTQFWRANPPEPDKSRQFNFVVEVENKAGKPRTTKEKHYLPSEVNPEHLIELSGFDVKYDVDKKKSYLYKEEELKLGEIKRYRIGIIDVWNVSQNEIEALKERTRVAYNLLKNTNYVESAGYLVKNIRERLEKVEESQAIEREINEHISAYRANKKLFVLAEEDVKALENLLNALRENLERSKLKNVLQKVGALKSLKNISQTIFKQPRKSTAWRIISFIVVFVAILTIIHFILWAKRSKDVKFEDEEEAPKSDKE